MNHQKTKTGWRLITPPTGEVISLESAKQQLRVTIDTEDALIQRNISIAREFIESRGRILAIQTWEMLLDEFPPDGLIHIWKNPVQSVEFIKYFDSDAVLQLYEVPSYDLRLTGNPAQIVLASGSAWPTTRVQPEAIAVRFTAGYNTSPPSIPWQLIGAMHLLIGHLHEHREAVIDRNVVALPVGMEDLIESAIGQARVY